MPFHHYIPVDNNPLVDQQLTLDAERSAYLCRVLRLRADATIRCFDGAGLTFEARLQTADPKQAVLEIVAVGTRHDPPDYAVHIGLSLIKGPGQDRALASAVELGVSTIHLFSSDRSNVRLDARRLEKKVSHWRNVIVAAAEQCGQVFVPQLELCSLDALLDNLPSKEPGQEPAQEFVVLEASASTTMPKTLPQQNYVLLVGPEGGWSTAELERFAALGITHWRLVEHILRAETVPSVALAMLSQAFR